MNWKHLQIAKIIVCMVALLLFRCKEPMIQFSELPPEETGLTFSNDITETQYNNILTYEYTYNGAGVAAGDLNNDGLPDLYFTGNSVPNKLYLNRGNWKFEDVTDQTKTSGRADWKTGVSMVDINGDGWLDIYVCYSGNAPGEGYNLPVIKDHPRRANELYINQGCEPGGIPVFAERAKEFGLDAPGSFSTQAYFFDYDRDGDLDMFLLNHANMFYAAFFNTKRLRNLRHPYFGNKLFRNDNNRFVEVSEQAGIHGSGLNFGLSAAIADLNDDDWPDLYVTNDYEEQDFCYINNRDGTFREVSHRVFGHLSKFGMGSDIADINNDGLPDIVVADMLPEDNYRQKLLKGPDEHDKYTLAVDSGYHHQYMRNTLQINRGFAADSLPRFSEVGQLAGISNTDWSWSPLFADFDNDGRKDLLITNGYLRDYTNLDFMKYTGNVYQQARSSNKTVDYLTIIQQLPSSHIGNYIFKNTDGLRFQNTSTVWGLTKKGVSNGAVYADLDNDGDYDLVMNNLNSTVSVYRNNQDKTPTNKFIKIRLEGKQPNTAALGAKVWVTTAHQKIYYEAFYARGYQSSVEPVINIGIGNSSSVEQILVRWPDGTETTLKNVLPNQVVTIRQDKDASATHQRYGVPNPILFPDVTASSGIAFRHTENTYTDFKTQRLLYYQPSRMGGKLSKGDVNNDGNDDVFFGGAAGQAGELYWGNDDGTFVKAEHQPWESEAAAEDIGSVFFDVDCDGDVDLYVVSGGSEFPVGSVQYQDRLYLNDGQGKFLRYIDGLPSLTTSGSCVMAADYDKDGKPDLFVGGRHVPSRYGTLPRSFILHNNTSGNAVTLTDVTAQVNSDLLNPGMVTAAVWTDINNDTWPDLMITGEWMPVRIFMNHQGKLIERKDPALENSNGWWTAIAEADLDDDGDPDYLLGNVGLNLPFKATRQEPVQLFAGDYNNDGALDPVLCHYIQGRSYPLATRDELLDQINTLRKKFVSYSSYANATIQDIASNDQRRSAYTYAAYTLQSAWLENVGGKSFILHALPDLAQVSVIHGFVADDITGDGKKEVLAAGNFYPFKSQIGRSDASVGFIFSPGNAPADAHRDMKAKVWFTGDIRDLTICRFRSGKRRIVVARNNDKASVHNVPGN